MFGIRMRLKEDLQVRKMLENEWTRIFEEDRENVRREARKKSSKYKNFNKKRKVTLKYGDLVAIKRTQFDPLKFRSNF